MLFGLHPLHLESVAWFSEGKDLLCALFFQLSIMVYVNQIRKENAIVLFAVSLNKQYLLSLSYFVLALLSRPMAVSLPFVLLILDWHPLQKIRSLKTFQHVLTILSHSQNIYIKITCLSHKTIKFSYFEPSRNECGSPRSKRIQ